MIKGFLISLLLIGTVHSATIDLEAVSLKPQEWTDFSIQYQDNGDFKPQLSEVTYFSGVTYLPFVTLYERLLDVPRGGWPFWKFDSISGWDGPTTVAASTWKYTQVPLPGSALLLGSGLLGLWLAGRRVGRK